jgi:hypothetical protein
MPHFYPPTPIPVNEIRSGLEHFVPFTVRGEEPIAEPGWEAGETRAALQANRTYGTDRTYELALGCTQGSDRSYLAL